MRIAPVIELKDVERIMPPPKKANSMTNTSSIPLVSIAMCTCNGERFLREQLDSLVAQDYPNLEIVVVDDQSSDSTFQILKEYARKSPRFQIHRNEQNLGFRKNFEKAISLCSGEFISLSDQDDIWFPHKISALVENIGEASLIYSNVQLVDENANPIDKNYPPAHLLEGRCYLGLLFDNCVTGHTCLFRKSDLAKAFPIPDNVKMHDYWIALVAAANKGLKLHSPVLSLYRQHSNNTYLDFKPRRRELKVILRYRAYRQRLAFIDAACTINTLSPREAELVALVRNAYARYPRCYRNRPLKQLLEKHRTSLLCIYLNPGKATKRLCNGLFRDLV